MKKLILIAALVITSVVNAQANKFTQLYNQFQNVKGVTTMTIDKGLFNMMGDMNLDKEVKNWNSITKSINTIKMIVIDGDNQNAKNNFKNSFSKLKLEELMAVNKDGSKVKFYTDNSNSKIIKNLLLSISSKEETVYLMLDGAFKLSDIQNNIKVISK
jgi:hypothetical protein